MLAKMKAFWLKETDYPNGSWFSRLEILTGQLTAIALLAAILGLILMLRYPIAYISHFVGGLL